MKESARILKLLAFFILTCCAVSRASDKYGSFRKSFIKIYAEQLNRLHQRNIDFIRNGDFDSVASYVNIDLKDWSYSNESGEWGLGDENPGTASLFSFSASNYYYAYNQLDGVMTSSVNLPSTNAVGDFNAWELSEYSNMSYTDQERRILVYHVRVFNLPFFYINDRSALFEPDSTESLFNVLKSLELTSDEKLRQARTACDDLGKALMQELRQMRSVYEAGSEHINYLLLFHCFSEPVLFNKVPQSFKYFNYYLQWVQSVSQGNAQYTTNAYVPDSTEIKKVIESNIRWINVNSEALDIEVAKNIVASLKCVLFRRCEDLDANFTKYWSAKLWNDFKTLAQNRDSSFFREKLNLAVKSATAIQYCENDVRAHNMYLAGIVQLDSTQGNGIAHLRAMGLAAAAYTLVAVHFIIDNSEFSVKGSEIYTPESTYANGLNVHGAILTLGNEDVEYDLDFNTLQTREAFVTLLQQLGLNFETDYYFYCFANDIEPSVSQYLYWLDHYGLKKPPVAVQMLARMINPTLSIYEIFTHHDVFTGEQLSGWDYFFNALDVFGIVGAVGEVGGALFRGMRVTRAGQVIDVMEATRGVIALKKGFQYITGITQGVKTACGKLVGWGKKMVFDNVSKTLRYLEDGVEKIVFKANRIDCPQLSLATGGEVKSIDETVEIYVNGEKQNGKFEMVKDESGEVGVRLAGELNAVYRGVTFQDFIATVPEFKNGAKQDLAQLSFKLWGEQKWSDLEELFITNNLNNSNGINWPPFNGSKGIIKVEVGEELAHKAFDRFQHGSNADKLSGSFASPVLNSSEGVNDLVFTYDSRALAGHIEEGTHYFKFQLKDEISANLKFEYGEAIPWFNLQGTADQIKSNVKFSDLIEGIDYEILEVLKYENGQWIKLK